MYTDLELLLLEELLMVKFHGRRIPTLDRVIELVTGESASEKVFALTKYTTNSTGSSYMMIKGDPSDWTGTGNLDVKAIVASIIEWFENEKSSIESEEVTGLTDKEVEGVWAIYSHVYKEGNITGYCSCGGHNEQHRRFIEIVS